MFCGLVVTVWLIISARYGPASLTRCQAWIIGLILFAIYPLNLWIYSQMNFQSPWPMHLCDWAAITGGIALMTRRRIFVELTFFWAIAGGTNALLTPDVYEGFPHPRFIVFFVHHTALVGVALWLTIGMGYHPRRGAVWKVFGWTQVFVVAALLTNVITGHNYGFLSHKPAIEHPLLDIIGPWPWYIFSLELVGLLLFLLLDLPSSFVRKSKRKRVQS